MAALNLDLPDEVRSRLEARSAQNGFDSVEAYVRALLTADAAGGPLMVDGQLESLLLGRIDGPFVDADAADFQRMRQKLRVRLDAGDRPDEAEPQR